MKHLYSSAILFLALGIFSFPACSTPPTNHDPVNKQDFDLVEVERKLKSAEGLEVEVHAAVPQYSLYVVTLRHHEDFFNFLHMSVITRNPELKKQLSELRRHDRIKVWGEFAQNDSPQKHIKLSALGVLKKFDPKPDIPKHDYPEKVPEELASLSSAKFLVHAVHADGKIVVVEYKDVVLPIFVTKNELTRDLFRNDKIILHYRIQESPGRPVHLELDPNHPQPVEIYDRLVEQHDREATLEGELILFPQSPQVSFDVFALLQTDADGISRNYTIVNFENGEVFKAIREKLGAAWKSDPLNFVSGRNKLVHNRIRVRAKGLLNVVEANQANPQIRVSDPADVEIIK